MSGVYDVFLTGFGKRRPEVDSLLRRVAVDQGDPSIAMGGVPKRVLRGANQEDAEALTGMLTLLGAQAEIRDSALVPVSPRLASASPTPEAPMQEALEGGSGKTTRSWSTGEKLVGVATIGTIVGAFLPWASVFGVNVSGINGDGVITLVIGLIGGAVLVAYSGAGKLRRSFFWIEVIAGGIVTLTALVDTGNGAGAIGLYLTLFAGIAWIAGAFMSRRMRPARTVTPPHIPAPPDDMS